MLEIEGQTVQPRFLHVPRTGGTSLVAGWGLLKPEYFGHSVIYDTDSWTYGFTRNPFDRLVSLYHHFQGPPLSFEEWISKGMPSVQYPPDRASFLAHPASLWLQGASWVGRFESRAEDLEELAAVLGRAVPEVHVAESRDRGPYQEYYTDRIRKAVSEIYAPDLDRWGYSFESGEGDPLP